MLAHARSKTHTDRTHRDTVTHDTPPRRGAGHSYRAHREDLARVARSRFGSSSRSWSSQR